MLYSVKFSRESTERKLAISTILPSDKSDRLNHILIACQSYLPFFGGVAVCVSTLANELIKRGISVSVVTLRSDDLSEREIIAGVTVYRVAVDKAVLAGYYRYKESFYLHAHGLPCLPAFEDNRTGNQKDFLHFNRTFAQAVSTILQRDSTIDLLHVFDFQLLPMASLLRSIPLAKLVTWCIPLPQNLWPFEQMLNYFSFYTTAIFIARTTTDRARQLGVDSDRILTLPPLTPLAQFFPRECDRIRMRFNIDLLDPLILSVQRFDGKGGQKQLIEAMAIVCKRFPRAKLALVYNETLSNHISEERSHYFNNCTKLVADLRISQNVLFLGNIEREEMADVYNAADIYALTSKEEGFGLSITEAMACGKVVVGTAVAGIKDQIIDQWNGCLVPVGDSDATAHVLVSLIANRARCRLLGERARNFVWNTFHPAKLSEQYVGLYLTHLNA